MKALRYIRGLPNTIRRVWGFRKWLHRLWSSQASVPTEIDSHKWENKIEILSSLSRGSA